MTGAASRIGLATAVEFARKGADLVAADIDKPALDAALAGVIAEGLSVETRHQDVTDRAAWDGLVDDIAAMAGEPQLAAYSAAKA